MSETEQRIEIPDPYSIALDEIDVMDPRLFHEDKHWRYFERLRQEDPVHLSEREHAGRFWSITKFDDIMAIDTNHRLFSSAHGIALGPRVDLNSHAEPSAFNMFISTDPPKHDEQRATVSAVVAPPNLKLLESTIRERAGTILDALPVGETFDWVDTVSIELTTQMLATLFDFPFEDRRKLTRWSDVVTAGQEEG
ncbi:MAG: cytochrome P450, partial [Pseudomonadota bacterium]|nr:cytochrome P450 [Pseudomonadota bacterium]